MLNSKFYGNRSNRPEYGDIVWDNCAKYEKEELEKIQYESACIAIGSTRLIFINSLYNGI